MRDQWIIWKNFENNKLERACDHHACYLQGILDSQFHSVQALKTEENPHFVLETVTVFCNDADNGIAQMTRYLEGPVVDFTNLTGLSHFLRGSSSSIGGIRVALACRDLRRASEANNKQGCIEGMARLKHEYNSLKEGLNNISQYMLCDTLSCLYWIRLYKCVL
ncbi:hypothetical protein ACB092_08G140600 [Castanea dentata]